MKRVSKKVRGIFERPKGSGVWWVNYYQGGKQHREKAGTHSAAIDLYRARKAAILEHRKLPDLRRGRPTLSALIDDALEYAKSHNGSYRDYVTKARIVREAMGSEIAANIKPQDIDRWLSKHSSTPATFNRYRSFISLVFREALRNGKVEANPARLVRQRKEPPGRLRFLSREEYDRLCGVIEKQCPEHLAEFVVSVNSGMRLSEQYTTDWGQTHLERKAIDLIRSKNGNSRTVHLNADAIAAINSLKRPKQRKSDLVFPNEAKRFDNRSWFNPALREAKVDNYHWHLNRHTFCSWLAMAGATIKEIQEAAGHKTISMSARYAHLSPTHRLPVVERITAAAQAGSTSTE